MPSRVCAAAMVLLTTFIAWGAEPAHKADPAKHWAYQPINRPPLPAVRQPQWVRTPVDRFILSRLQDSKFSPSPEADRRTLLRRIYFDLVGLPPTFEQVKAFECDPSPDALERVVDALLDSPLYGQRWGRHWLDVARYADTMGYNFLSDPRYPFAWTYRDYVIDAFNSDKPYDRFVTEQIAADWLGQAGPRGKGALAGMGFLTVGRRFDFDIHATTDDRIDVVTRGLMGMTVQCARCHDHKYDAITQADYYALYGVFRSSVEPETDKLPVIAQPDGAALERFNTELAKRQKEVDDFYANLLKSIQTDARARAAEFLKAASGKTPRPAGMRPALIDRFKAKWEKHGSPGDPTPEQVKAISEEVAGLSLEEAKAMVTPEELMRAAQLKNKVQNWHIESPDAPARAMVMNDAQAMFDPYIFKRGQAMSIGDRVPRRFLSVLAPMVGGEPFKQGSGRLDLAQAIVHPRNPLTARVIANRVWQWHFGEGLVRTPSDFGVRGQPPTHPELLDYLARALMDSGWSIKKLHRLIVLSAAYRQSSADRPDCQKIDAENRLLWRFGRHRLEFEPMRDAMLYVAGRLDTRLGGRSQSLVEPPYTTRRSVYGAIDRQYLDRTLRTFDFANPDATEPSRPDTTVPQQALFLMNSKFITDQIQELLKRSEVAATVGAARVKKLYEIVLSREPNDEEVKLGLSYVSFERQHQSEGQIDAWVKFAQALMICNEFMFVD